MEFLNQELDSLRANDLFRQLRRLNGPQTARTIIDGKSMLLLASNSYLGLTTHPKLKAAAIEAIERFGTGSGGSRLTTGNYALHEELEAKIAEFKETEAAIVFNTGYMANLGVITALVGSEDVVFSDEYNHASIIDGCRLARTQVWVYRHNDMEHLAQLLADNSQARRKLVVVDGVFSMDGDIVTLDKIVDLGERYDAIVMVDDAHATGVLGKNGAGTTQHYGLKGRVHIQMGTLSKALASEGGYVAGSRTLIDYLRNKSRSFIFSTALPPADMAVATAAIDIVVAQPEIRKQLWENVQYLRDGLANLGFPLMPGETPILPILIGDAGQTVRMAEKLAENGVFAPGIRPPTVPAGSSRIRVTVMATHTRVDLDEAIAVFGKVGREIGVI
jgi:predicted pyridoxal phosphate-dependent acyltransferase